MKLAPERFMVDESLIDQDYTYMKQLCPPAAKQLFDRMEDTCDRLEYEGSFLYDECPDKITLEKLADEIARQVPDLETVSGRDFIQALLCDEILCRRQRYYRKKKMFQS